MIRNLILLQILIAVGFAFFAGSAEEVKRRLESRFGRYFSHEATANNVTEDSLVPIFLRGDFQGQVRVALNDDQGGWYVGGLFSKILQVERNNIAHVYANGSVDPIWNPNANGVVNCLSTVGNLIFVCGAFTNIGGEPRNYLAALDAFGKATPWNPNPDAEVQMLKVFFEKIYVSGEFSAIGGGYRNSFAALDFFGRLTNFGF